MQIQLPKNLDEVKAGFDPLPEGTYKVRATKADLKTSAKGNPYLAITFTVIENDAAEYNNRKLFHNVTITDETMGFVKEVLEALGTPWDGNSFDTEDVIGNEALVSVKVQARADNPEQMQNVIKKFARA